MFRKLTFLVLMLGLFIAGCEVPVGGAPAAPAPVAEGIHVTDGLGREVTLAGPAQRVVSLAPSNTEILFAIGAGGQTIGRDALSDYPAEAADVTDIGDTGAGPDGQLTVDDIIAFVNTFSDGC